MDDLQPWDASQQFIGCESVDPGNGVLVKLKFMSPMEHRERIFIGMKFNIREGLRIVGVGVVENLNPEFR